MSKVGMSKVGMSKVGMSTLGSFSRFAGLCFALAISGMASAQQVSPPDTQTPNWEVCNETSFVLRLATASINDGKMSARGWSRLIPGGCRGMEIPLNTPRYIYAESDSLHQGGIREWKGNAELCASDEDFVADATRECAAQDFGSRGYLQIDPQETRTALVEPDNFGKNAYNAGLQRLLRDNGFSISRVDGVLGRRSQQNLRAFLKTNDLASDLGETEVLNALAKAAQQKQASVGLTLCNETSNRLWSAIGFRESGGWESRGWWSIEVGTCVRPFTESLEGQDVHFFASQERPAPDSANPEAPSQADRELRNISAKPLQFCVTDSQFSALGREYCADKGYRVENFRAVTSEELGQKIILLDSDFADPNPSGLRR